MASAVVLFAWFPAGSLLSQRSDLHGTEAELNALHAQDAALAQEKKNLSDAGEIGRIAREQYQLVSPGQQAYEVLPPSGATAAGTPYAGDPGSDGAGDPVGHTRAPTGRRHHDDHHAAGAAAAHRRGRHATAASTSIGRIRLAAWCTRSNSGVDPRGTPGRPAQASRRRGRGARCSAATREAPSPSWCGATTAARS